MHKFRNTYIRQVGSSKDRCGCTAYPKESSELSRYAICIIMLICNAYNLSQINVIILVTSHIAETLNELICTNTPTYTCPSREYITEQPDLETQRHKKDKLSVSVTRIVVKELKLST